MPGEQLSIAYPDAYRTRMHAEQLTEACRSVAEQQTFRRTAAELDEVFGPIGHPVSQSILANALNDRERNYPRLEWAVYFAERSSQVAHFVAASAGCDLVPRRRLTAEERLAKLERTLVSKLGAVGAQLLEELER